MTARPTRRVRALRRQAPLTERLLWDQLRDRRLRGLKFRRQVPIAGYVVDFACFSPRLVIEADGPFHDPEADARRDAVLRAEGFTVVRFANQQLEDDLNGVLHTVLAAARRT